MSALFSPEERPRLVIWTYRKVAGEYGPERVQAVITEGGRGDLTLPLSELPAGAFLNDHFPAHCKVAKRLARCPISLAEVRKSGSGYIFWGFPEETEEGGA